MASQQAALAAAPARDPPRGAAPRTTSGPTSGRRARAATPRAAQGASITATLRRLLEQGHNGRTIQEILAEKVIKEAISGKHNFAKELLDRIDGRPAQRVELPAQEDLITFVVPPPRTMTPEEYEVNPSPGKAVWGIGPDDV